MTLPNCDCGTCCEPCGHDDNCIRRDAQDANQETLTAEQWNERHPVGTPVIAYPGVRPEYSGDGYTRLETRTRSRAWNLGHGEPVVKVDGYAGGISLEHIDPTALEG